MKKALLTCWLVVMAVGIVRAQPFCSVRTFTIRDGLAANMISGMEQTGDNLMWFSTWNGLCCYDGYTFHTFRDNLDGDEVLTSNRLLTVRPNTRGDLWCLSYDRHLYLFDTHRCRYVDVGQTIGKQFGHSPRVRGVYSLANGHTWIVGYEHEPSYCVSDSLILSGEGITRLLPNSRQVKGTYINKVVADAAGREWIFANHGVTCQQASFATDVPYDYFQQLNTTTVLATPDGRLALWREGWKHERNVSLPSQVTAITAMEPVDDHTLVLATPAGLLLCDTETATAHLVSLLSDAVKTLYVDTRQRIWAFTDRQGVTLVDLHRNTARLLQPVLPLSLMVTTSETPFFHEDGHGTVWMVPAGGTFSYFDETSQTLVPYALQSVGLMATPLPVINKYMADNQHNLWFTGSRDLTLLNFGYHHWLSIPVTEGQEARSVAADRDGRLWVGMYSGELAVADSTGKRLGYLRSDGQIVTSQVKFSDRIYALHIDRVGRLWIGSKGQGLYVRHPDGRLFHYVHRPEDVYSLSHDEVYGFDEDRDGRMWVATYGGGPNLAVADAVGQMQFYHPGNALRGYPGAEFMKVRRITHDRHDTMILSTNNGLVTFAMAGKTADSVVCYTSRHIPGDKQSLTASDVMQVLVTNSGSTIVITAGGGVQKMESAILLRNDLRFKTLKALVADDGLPQSVAEDGSGHLWVVRESSIDRYYPQQDSVETFGPNELGEHVKFSEAQPVVAPGSGAVCLAVSGGALVLRPGTMQKSTYSPHIIFTGVSYQGDNAVEPLLNRELLDVPSDRRNLTIYFSALDYTDNYQVRYAYRIEGHDKDWNYVGSAHAASFNQLPPGRLRLLVKSTNADGVWMDNVTVLNIHSHPTFWETPWAWLLYLLLLGMVVGVAFYIYRLRTRIQMNRELTDMKTRFFTEVEDADKAMMKQLTDFLDENISNSELKIDDLAEAMNMGRSVFYNKVKTIVGMTPVDFVRHVRIKHAQNLIANTTQNFSQIAYAVGFSDPKYFSKCFKKETGQTPSEYRKKILS